MKQKTTPTGQPTSPLVTIKKLRILLIDIFGLLMAFWVTFFLDKRFYLQHPLPYGTAEESGEFAERTGGMGSTGK